jgi:hypothetical protein
LWWRRRRRMRLLARWWICSWKIISNPSLIDELDKLIM